MSRLMQGKNPSSSRRPARQLYTWKTNKQQCDAHGKEGWGNKAGEQQIFIEV